MRSHLRRSFLVLTAGLALAACATAPPSAQDPPRLDDVAVTEAVGAMLRSLDPAPPELVLFDLSVPAAAWRPDGRLSLTRGMLLRLARDDELRFVLAHELGHRALAHAFPGRSGVRSRAQELAADAFAAKVAGAAAGTRLLHALLAEARATGRGTVADREELAVRRGALVGGPIVVSGGEPGDAWRELVRERGCAWIRLEPAVDAHAVLERRLDLDC